jgi:hypothetical protein
MTTTSSPATSERLAIVISESDAACMIQRRTSTPPLVIEKPGSPGSPSVATVVGTMVWALPAEVRKVIITSVLVLSTASHPIS